MTTNPWRAAVYVTSVGLVALTWWFLSNGQTIVGGVLFAAIIAAVSVARRL